MAVFDRLAALLLGLFLLVLGILVPVEIVHSAVLTRTGELILPWQTLTRFFTGHDWSTSPILAISIITALIGLLLLLVELKRRRPGLLTLTTEDEHLTAGTTRRSVQRALAARAEDVDGISGPRATALSARSRLVPVQILVSVRSSVGVVALPASGVAAIASSSRRRARRPDHHRSGRRGWRNQPLQSLRRLRRAEHRRR